MPALNERVHVDAICPPLSLRSLRSFAAILILDFLCAFCAFSQLALRSLAEGGAISDFGLSLAVLPSLTSLLPWLAFPASKHP
jgi:hypothetical protein